MKHMKHHDEKGHHSPARSKIAKSMRGEGMEKRKESKVFKEFGKHELHSGSKKGPVVKEKKQAVAIAMSEGRKAEHKGKRHKEHKREKHKMSAKKREHEHEEKKKRHEKE